MYFGPPPQVTSMAYGGDDMNSLYIVDSKANNILIARMPVAGKRMYSHAEACVTAIHRGTL